VRSWTSTGPPRHGRRTGRSWASPSSPRVRPSCRTPTRGRTVHPTGPRERRPARSEVSGAVSAAPAAPAAP
jgi:hypothetical protein